MTVTDPGTALQEREAKASRSPGAANIVAKVVLVGLIDALLIVSLAKCASDKWWLATVFFAILLVAVNFAYFTGRAMPLKYLLPGIAFLVVFQLYTMYFTAFSSFTNYGTGHLGTKDDAITAIEQQSVVPVAGATQYAVVPIIKGGTLAMLLTDPKTGQVSIGTNDGLTSVSSGDVTKQGDRVTGVKGYDSLNLIQMSTNADYKAQWAKLHPPVDKAAGTYFVALSITRAGQAKAGFVYDKAKDAMVSSTNAAVYPASSSKGNFSTTDGKRLDPGWRVSVGVHNYSSLLSDKTLRSRFLPIAAWTFVFAILSTFLCFSLGLLLALILSERRMRGQGLYRFLLIIPYGLPGILTTLVWKGMLNTNFGLVNQILGSQIPWLTNASLARLSVLMVNLWMGFPYFFLVCSGSLTAIPADLKEAAYVDGASGRHAFRTVVLPLLLVATAPLLVTTFAFNFNNYSLIQLLTSGGPFPGSFNAGGSTDLLINFTFRTAFNDSSQQLGLASAIAMVIFVVVGTVSAYGFRLTKRLEEIGR